MLHDYMLQLISVILYPRLFFLYCYDVVWYKELDLKPYWSQVCTVGSVQKDGPLSVPKSSTPFYCLLDPFLDPYFSCCLL